MYALFLNNIPKLKFYLTDEVNLWQVVQHRSEKLKGILRPPTGYPLDYSLDEFRDYIDENNKQKELEHSNTTYNYLLKSRMKNRKLLAYFIYLYFNIQQNFYIHT